MNLKLLYYLIFPVCAASIMFAIEYNHQAPLYALFAIYYCGYFSHIVAKMIDESKKRDILDEIKQRTTNEHMNEKTR